jgi:hypothetical protein
MLHDAIVMIVTACDFALRFLGRLLQLRNPIPWPAAFEPGMGPLQSL